MENEEKTDTADHESDPSIASLTERLKAANLELENLRKDVSTGKNTQKEIDRMIAAGELYSRDRFANLSRKLTEVTAERDNYMPYKKKYADISDKYGELVSSTADAQDALAKLTETNETLTSRSKRMELVMEKFPELIPLELSGALPTVGDPEELNEKLTAFAKVIENAAKGKEPGETPSHPATPNINEKPNSISEMLNNLKEAKRLAVSSGNWDEVYRLEDELRVKE